MDLIKDFIERNNIGSAVSATKAVAEIPWGKGRTIEEVLQEKGVGTCTGKHLVLQECLEELGIEFRPIVCTFKWEDQGISFPDNLLSLLKIAPWEHGHNFVQIKNSNDEWIDVDITWDPPLESYGFKVLPTDWDGQTSFLGVKTITRWDGIDMKQKKKELIEGLSEEQEIAREEFLNSFIDWIASLR
ncbi:MAG: hypothetical protein QF755_01835 [Candidatus Peribacteraceae bacterium]|jgi:hypothetical protein|nr:hypothetical protein [Candidatus Peribacteraceae bacterium]HCI04151.1 hypothetical protein [Candidatus Peribacteria bacterium]|tara:strand:+ start:1752 stop:2312 length:561 start_codon:yes stop_codon:yes gene_type:complete